MISIATGKPDPQRDVAAIAECLLILAPVSDAIRRFVFGVSIGSFVGLGHALYHWLSRLIMSDDDEQFNGHCQLIGSRPDS